MFIAHGIKNLSLRFPDYFDILLHAESKTCPSDFGPVMIPLKGLKSNYK